MSETITVNYYTKPVPKGYRIVEDRSDLIRTGDKVVEMIAPEGKPRWCNAHPLDVGKRVGFHIYVARKASAQ